MTKKFLFFLPAIIWALIIFLLSFYLISMPGSSPFNIPYLDKAAHFVFYFILAFLVYFGFEGNLEPDSKKIMRCKIVTVILVIIYGIIIEILQETVTKSRQGDIVDILSNAMGAFLAILSYFFIRRQITRLINVFRF